MDTLDTMYSKNSNFYIARFEVQVLGKEPIVPDTPYLGLSFYNLKLTGCKQGGQNGGYGLIRSVPLTYRTDWTQ
jgi:hypothetical protein